MAQRKSILNKYIASYETLRDFLGYLCDGCYQKEQLAKLADISARSYEDGLARTQFLLPAEHLITHRACHSHIHAIPGSRYRTAYNALALSYRAHGLTPTAAFYYVTLLQLLAAGPPQRERELLARLVQRTAERPPALPVDLSPRTLHRYLTRLVELGVIERLPDRNRYRYQLAPAILTDLSPGEEREVLLAIAAYREMALTSVPGYQLAGATSAPLQLRHSAISRILADETVGLITCAIMEGYSVTLRYRGKSITVRPLRIRTDMRRARSYFLALPLGAATSGEPQTYRLDRIKNIQLGAPLPAVASARMTASTATKKPPLVIAATVTDDAERDALRYHIAERYPEATISEEELGGSTILCAAIDAADPLALIPWLRTLEPPVAIVSPAHRELQTRLLTDAEEALAHYDLYTATP